MKKNFGKRKYRSASEDPNDSSFTFKRTFYNLEENLQVVGKSLSTPFFIRPFSRNQYITFSIPTNTIVELKCLKSIIFEIGPTKFDAIKGDKSL